MCLFNSQSSIDMQKKTYPFKTSPNKPIPPLYLNHNKNHVVQYRISWRSLLTNYRGNGNWFESKDKKC